VQAVGDGKISEDTDKRIPVDVAEGARRSSSCRVDMGFNAGRGGGRRSVVAPMGSAAGESPSALGVGRGVVELEVVVERRLVGLGELLAVLLDVRRGLDLLLGHRDL
jgi:hypothetical protein